MTNKELPNLTMVLSQQVQTIGEDEELITTSPINSPPPTPSSLHSLSASSLPFSSHSSGLLTESNAPNNNSSVSTSGNMGGGLPASSKSRITKGLSMNSASSAPDLPSIPNNRRASENYSKELKQQKKKSRSRNNKRTNTSISPIHMSERKKLQLDQEEAQSRLFEALKDGIFTDVRQQCEAGVDITGQEPVHGQTPLHISAARGSLDIVKYLLQQHLQKIDVNAHDHRGNTPLHLAVIGQLDCTEPQEASKYIEIIQYLIAFGADTETTNEERMTPLVLLTSDPNPNPKIKNELETTCSILYTIPCPYVKLVTLGDAGCGKTSALQYMQLKRKPKVITLPLPTIGLTINPEKFVAKNLDFQIWDLSGCREYSSIHPYLMSRSRVIYLLFVSLARPWQPQVHYWSDFLRKTTSVSSTADILSSVILVGTKLDLLSPEESERAEKEFLHFCIHHRFNSFELVSVKEHHDKLLRLRESIFDVGMGMVSQTKISQYEMNMIDLFNRNVNSVVFRGIDVSNPYNVKCLTVLHDIGHIIFDITSGTIFTHPELMVKAMALFIGPEEHRDFLSDFDNSQNSFSPPRSVFPVAAVEGKLRNLLILAGMKSSTKTLKILLRLLEIFNVGILASQQNHQTGILFPALCPIGHFSWPRPNVETQKLRTLAVRISDKKVNTIFPHTFYRIQVLLREYYFAKTRDIFIYSNGIQINLKKMMIIMLHSTSCIEVLLRGEFKKGLWSKLMKASDISSDFWTFTPLDPESLFSEVARHPLDLSRVKAFDHSSCSLPLDLFLCGYPGECLAPKKDLWDILGPFDADSQWRNLSFIPRRNSCDSDLRNSKSVSEKLSGSMASSAAPNPYMASTGGLGGGEEELGGVGSGGGGKGVGCFEIRPPVDSDWEVGKLEYERVKEAFKALIGKDKFEEYTINKIVVINNESFLQQFKSTYQKFKEQPVNRTWLSVKNSEDMEHRDWIMSFKNFNYSIPGEESTNICLSWYCGKDHQSLMEIAETNFTMNDQHHSTFGKGIYFTNNHGFQEIKRNQHPRPRSKIIKEGEAPLILCWTLLGNIYPVTESPDLPHSLSDKPLLEGYDSHYVLVTETPDDLFPCKPLCSEGPDMDLIVLASSKQILPRYVVHYSHLDLYKGQKINRNVVYLTDDPNEETEFYSKLSKIVGVRLLHFSSFLELREWLQMDAIKAFSKSSSSSSTTSSATITTSTITTSTTASTTNTTTATSTNNRSIMINDMILSNSIFIVSSPTMGGNESGGIQLCQWLKHQTNPWNTVPFFLFSPTGTEGLHLQTSVEEHIFVSESFQVLYEFINSGGVFTGPIPPKTRRSLKLNRVPSLGSGGPGVGSGVGGGSVSITSSAGGAGGTGGGINNPLALSLAIGVQINSPSPRSARGEKLTPRRTSMMPSQMSIQLPSPKKLFMRYSKSDLKDMW